VAHAVCGQETHGAECLVKDRIFEYVGTGDEVHAPICKLQADAQGVVKAVLVVRNHDCGCAIYGNIFQTDDMLLTEVEARVYILQIDAKRLQKE
jgi:hypothetical protein